MPTTKFKNKYRIKSTRLQNWDYSSDGWYFVTICTKDKECFFGEIKKNQNDENVCELNEIGEISKKYWQEIPKHFPNVQLDEFIVMPNHVHGIIVISNDDAGEKPEFNFTPNFVRRDAINRVSTGGVTGQHNPMLHQSLSRIIRWYKGRCSFEINKLNNPLFNFHWQPRFHDHIIRNQTELEKIQHYIFHNAQKWEQDINFKK